MLDGTRLGGDESILAVRVKDDEPALHVTDAKALYDLLQRRSGNAGHCRRAQIDVSVICVSARALKCSTHWVPGEFMEADPLTKRNGNSSFTRKIMRLAKYAIGREGQRAIGLMEVPPKDVNE